MAFSRSFEYSTGHSEVKINTLPFTGAQKENRVEIEEGCHRWDINLLNLYVPLCSCFLKVCPTKCCQHNSLSLNSGELMVKYISHIPSAPTYFSKPSL